MISFLPVRSNRFKDLTAGKRSTRERPGEQETGLRPGGPSGNSSTRYELGIGPALKGEPRKGELKSGIFPNERCFRFMPAVSDGVLQKVRTRGMGKSGAGRKGQPRGNRDDPPPDQEGSYRKQNSHYTGGKGVFIQ